MARLFGVNVALSDAAFNSADTVSLLGETDNQVLRFPSGPYADEYHWATNTTFTDTWTWANSFDSFAGVARSTGAQVFIATNYGSGTPQEAASWGHYSNITRAYGFKYWGIGNECYGPWQYDTHATPHDPYTYAVLAEQYIALMKTADPTIKVGVVVVAGEDSYANNTDHPATNPRTGHTHHGWTPVMLQTLKNLGVTPDFVFHHKYAQEPGTESDANLLLAAHTIRDDVASLRGMLADYLGAAGANVEIVCGEANSVSYNPGK